MYTTCLKQILYVVLIFNIAKAFKTDVNYGNCENVSSEERLPVTIIEPLHYKLLLHMFMESEIFGDSNIVINVRKPTIKLSLHCFGLDIYKHSISLSSISKVTEHTTKYSPSSYRFCTKTQILDIFFDETILPGLYNLYMLFISMHHNNLGNFIRYQYTTYTAAETTKRWFLGILSTSNRARTVFPCWDEPEIYMNYEVVICHSEQYQVISNMPMQKLLHEPNNMSLTYFHTSKPIASSQVAVIMVDNIIQHTWDKEYLWCKRRITVEETNILKEIYYMKKNLMTYFKVEDRIMKTDNIMIPNFPLRVIGSLGVIIYREQSIKFDNNIDFSGRKINIYKMIGDASAREVLAQVICPSYVWLIKILASFLSHFAIFQNSTYSSFMDLSVVQTMQGALYYDVDFQMAPVSQNKFLFPTDEIDAIHYSRLYYNKGAALMRMFLYFFEEPEYFSKRIRKCIEECENTSASISDLWIEQSVLLRNEQMPYNITEIMDTWITQKHFPELKVDCDHNRGSIILSAYNCNETRWKIPITYVLISNHTFVNNTPRKILFDCSKDEYIYQKNIYDFIIVNVEQMGYYRVNYDSTNWVKISTHLNFLNYTQINVLNRARLIDDAYYFMMNDKLAVNTFLHLIKYLKRERHYVAWYSMFNIFTYMSKYFELPESTKYEPYWLDILGSLLEHVKFEELTENDDMIKSLRLLGLRWACKFGHELCKTTAALKLTLVVTYSFKILPWWKEWIYCAGMMDADSDVWNKLLDKYSGIYSQENLTYLACTEHDNLPFYYLHLLWTLKPEQLMISNSVCTDPEKSYEIIFTAYRSFVKKHARKNAVLKYILDHYSRLSSTILGSKSSINVLGVTILELCSKDNFEQVISFVKSSENLTNEEKKKLAIFVSYRKIELKMISHNFRMF